MVLAMFAMHVMFAMYDVIRTGTELVVHLGSRCTPTWCPGAMTLTEIILGPFPTDFSDLCHPSRAVYMIYFHLVTTPIG